MLPQDLRDRVQELVQTLQPLQQTAASASLDRVALKQGVDAVQKFFQHRIANLNSEDIAAAEVSRVQSYITEIDKQLRFLGMDVMFLQAARQSATQAQRQQQMGDRLQTLIGYCDALLRLGTEDERSQITF